MSEWREYILEEVVEKFIDYRGKTPTKTSFGVPLITAKIVKDGSIIEPNEFIAKEDYDSWMTRGFPEINDVVITTEAPLGEVALIKSKNVALAQRIITLQTNKKLCNSIFLKYYFQSYIGQGILQARASGSTVEGIKSAELKKVEISLPPLPEQTDIAEVLSSLDDKIDLLHRQNKTLEQLAETLFRQWFVKEAEEGWKETIFGELVKPKKGQNITKATAVKGKYPVVAGGLEPSCYHIQSNTSAPVITVSSSGANAGFVRIYYSPIWASDCSYIDKEITPYLYFSYVFLKINQRILFDKQEGSAQPHIYPSHIMEIEMKKYPKRIVELFEEKATPFFQKVKSNTTQIHTLIQLRETLLPKLMSGEVRVSELTK